MKQTMNWLFVEEQGNSVVYRCSVCNSEISVKYGEELPYCKHCESEPDGEQIANKMSDNEIIQALKHCTNKEAKYCTGCPLSSEMNCVNLLAKEALDHITRKNKIIEMDINTLLKKDDLMQKMFEQNQQYYDELQKVKASYEKVLKNKEQYEAETSQDIHSYCAEIRTLQNAINTYKEETSRLQSILLCFMDEVDKWENKHCLDVSELPLIPIKNETAKIKNKSKPKPSKSLRRGCAKVGYQMTLLLLLLRLN